MGDKVLFTPGPLNTNLDVKKAGLRDLGSRDKEFIEICNSIKIDLLRLANFENKKYEVILLQGPGTYGLEAVMSTFTPPDGKWLIISNGDYGHRLTLIAQALGINFHELSFPSHTVPQIDDVESYLLCDPDVTHVSLTHCETTTGILNPVEEILRLEAISNKEIFIDAISSFGLYKINEKKTEIDYFIGSPNKCLESIPGFCFIFVKTDKLGLRNYPPRSFSLDLLGQFREFEESGQFRFTPPVQSILVLKRALEAYFEEGGLQARFSRYQNVQNLIIDEMEKMGFETIVEKRDQSVLITSFKFPSFERFNFVEFYKFLSERGTIIYSGKTEHVNSFRIGHMGQISNKDVDLLINNIKLYLDSIQKQS